MLVTVIVSLYNIAIYIPLHTHSFTYWSYDMATPVDIVITQATPTLIDILSMIQQATPTLVDIRTMHG